jgi:hypothetical protein
VLEFLTKLLYSLVDERTKEMKEEVRDSKVVASKKDFGSMTIPSSGIAPSFHRQFSPP